MTVTAERLTELTEAVAEATAAVASIRQERDAEIVQATREGMRQRDIVEATGLTREQVRRIVRAGEVE